MYCTKLLDHSTGENILIMIITIGTTIIIVKTITTLIIATKYLVCPKLKL